MPNYARGLNPGEKPIPISEAARLAGVTPQAVYNWILAGKLRASKIRGYIRTSREALAERDQPEPIELPEPAPRTPSQARRDHNRAEEYLRSQGYDI